jgi:hypothetical protein
MVKVYKPLRKPNFMSSCIQKVSGKILFLDNHYSYFKFGNALADALKEKDLDIKHIQNNKEALSCLNSKERINYILTIYDTLSNFDSFHDKGEQRSQVFINERVGQLLGLQSPVIVLADKYGYITSKGIETTVAESIYMATLKAGFSQINMPCDITDVLNAINQKIMPYR